MIDDDLGVDVLYVAANTAHSSPLPYTPDLDEHEQLKRDYHAALARKRPAGFAPWPGEEQPATQLRAVS